MILGIGRASALLSGTFRFALKSAGLNCGCRDLHTIGFCCTAATIDAIVEGKPKLLNSRYTNVWVKGAKGWQMVVWQSTPIPASTG
jgi:hypothetical protein